MDDDDTNCLVADAFDRYERRTDLDNMCLADFVAVHKTKSRADGLDQTAQHCKVIRYVRYSHKQDPVNFFREQCLLFLPWRSEQNDIMSKNCQTLYEENKSIIRDNQKKYVTIPEEEIDELFKNLETENGDNSDDDFDEDCYGGIGQEEQIEPVDILEQGGVTKPKSKYKSKRYFTPQKFPFNTILSMLETLNSKQRLFVMEIMKRLKTKKTPFYVFLSGAAGVGKSTVINAIHQLTTHYFDNIHGENPDSLKVLLTAFAGKAACIINGTTLHTAFALPFNQMRGSLPELSNDVANTIRSQLVHLKLLIIDEISMVGTKIFHYVNQRLIQITGQNLPFGGVNVIVVGDLHQLPPVGDQKVFKPLQKPNNNPIGKLFGPVSQLWENFEYFQLTEVMRQKDDAAFVDALNNLVVGKMTEDDIKLLKSRECEEENVPEDAIRLYHFNSSVDKYNEKRIKEMPGTLYKHKSYDSIVGKISEKCKKQKLRALQNSTKKQETNGLPTILHLKIGIKYMVTVNIDIEDGLVNGVTGLLKHILFDDSKEPKVLYLEFESARIGQKAIRENKNDLNHNAFDKICDKWVPLREITLEISNANKSAYFQTYRRQFPISPAEAITIHKSQGSTFETICVDTREKLSRQLLYVALSRVIN